ncbi:glycoside hydrolase family 127 protein [Cellulomonas cellasea]|uniref:glycoside hydrolase family 127 protein n=1 Tax=Cellulomonas cellasea TaxID=43670 RepID=UPI0025A31AE8|nr:beta-L-arabinofuranosidase domain-containing protein [Cellulomonas cellasea]MDM8085418.1 glycoside hydrolase family 127 protein [Cellulomonas cellasea]
MRTPSPHSGPVAPRAAERLAQQPLPASSIRLDPDGHLGAWQRLNAAATIPHCVEMLEDSGALDNLRRVVGRADGPHVGYNFADSDVYKVLEAIGWEIGRTGTAEWDGFLDATLELLAAVQDADGYLNSWVQGTRPDERFSDLRWSHELYCTGHLVQAAIALHRGAGRTDFLDLARRAADLLVRRFGPDGQIGVCGHPEIETALVELYRTTAHDPYLDLARRMVDARGQGLLGPDRLGPHYFQDHAPVRASREATGHAVRQVYLNAGVTDVYTEQGDPSLLGAMRDQWASAHEQKMHLTGALGSRHFDESFGDPYELPPDRAYAETCAAIGDVMWGHRMLLVEGGSRHADAMERALLNAIAAAVGEDGRAFFYSNPLHLRAGHREEENAPSRRTPWYACACCPPNIARLVASLHAYVSTRDEDTLYVHLLTAAEIDLPPGLGQGTLRVTTDYPASGVVHVELDGRLADGAAIALRTPGWATQWSLAVDGIEVGEPEVRDGYVVVRGSASARLRVDLELAMEPRLVAAHPRVDAVRGTRAVLRGPVVYCVEQADHPGQGSIEDLVLLPGAEIGVTPGAPGSLPTLRLAAVTRPAGDAGLYATAPAGERDVAACEWVEATAIPYARWGNREPGPMRVWLPLA